VSGHFNVATAQCAPSYPSTEQTTDGMLNCHRRDTSAPHTANARFDIVRLGHKSQPFEEGCKRLGVRPCNVYNIICAGLKSVIYTYSRFLAQRMRAVAFHVHEQGRSHERMGPH
jgi:hypothetical protein